MKVPSLHDYSKPIRLGGMQLDHRLAMASTTHERATAAGVPTTMNAEYYAQRAPMGLIITEGTHPNADGQGCMLTPGIHTAEQVAGWRDVTRAVHAAGGRVIIQLMHVGRIAHPSNTSHHRRPVAPSAIKPRGLMLTATGPLEMPEPRALSTTEVAETVAKFADAARLAIEAGADGVEIHGANGYLVQQFLSSNANQRTDRYGGSRDNRIRFAVEIATAVAEAIGPERVGLHVSPGSRFNDIVENDIVQLYDALLIGLAPLGLAYLHVVHHGDEAVLARFRARWHSVLIVNRVDADLDTRFADIAKGRADMISIGNLPLANPDPVASIRIDAPPSTTS